MIRRLGGNRSQYGRLGDKKNLATLGIEPGTAEPVVRRYPDCYSVSSRQVM
jgi:hypothetical protein